MQSGCAVDLVMCSAVSTETFEVCSSTYDISDASTSVISWVIDGDVWVRCVYVNEYGFDVVLDACMERSEVRNCTHCGLRTTWA